jgi:hypothetical protein
MWAGGARGHKLAQVLAEKAPGSKEPRQHVLERGKLDSACFLARRQVGYLGASLAVAKGGHGARVVPWRSNGGSSDAAVAEG